MNGFTRLVPHPPAVERAEKLIRQAAAQGANIILIQELFETPYFCQDQLPGHFELARPVEGNDGIARFQKLARELDVVLPFSFFERDNQAYFNSVAMIDAGGELRDGERSRSRRRGLDARGEVGGIEGEPVGHGRVY
jgi:predicted amidohydrolase